MSTGIVENLVSGIYTVATGANTFNTAVGGRIFYEKAHQSDGDELHSFPFAVFLQVVDSQSATFTSEYAEVDIQWSIYDNSASAQTLMDAAGKLHDLFDYNAAVSVTGWTIIRFDRMTHMLLPRDAFDIRTSTTTYRVWAQKTS